MAGAYALHSDYGTSMRKAEQKLFGETLNGPGIAIEPIQIDDGKANQLAGPVIRGAAAAIRGKDLDITLAQESGGNENVVFLFGSAAQSNGFGSFESEQASIILATEHAL
jgi:hypothetical protein